MDIVNEVRSEQMNEGQRNIGTTTSHEKASNGRPSTESSRNMPDYTILTPLRKERNADKPLLSEREQQQIALWNATQQSYPQDVCVHQFVEKQAANTPEATALWANGQVMTYAQLNQQANQLAHYLQTLGIGPNVLVGLCVERSLNMVVGMLSILKAGGTYVPLDPAYPAERLNYMLKDAQITVLLTQKHLTARLAEQQTHPQGTDDHGCNPSPRDGLGYIIGCAVPARCGTPRSRRPP